VSARTERAGRATSATHPLAADSGSRNQKAELRTVAAASRKRKRILVLVTDAYGGHGGIAAYNRDVLRAFCEDDSVAEVVALPRVISSEVGSLPDKLLFDTESAGGTRAYLRRLAKQLRGDRFDLVYCAHIHLVPLAWAAAKLNRCPWLFTIYGIDAWQPPTRAAARFFFRRADQVNAVSQVTLDRFLKFSGFDARKTFIVPNAIHLEEFSPGPKSDELARRLDVAGRRVVMTFGRLASEERYKGFDEVLDILPRLIRKVPDIVYIIAGTGPDRERLERRAEAMGLQDYVRFTGYVAEEDKADLYRLTDVYAMPSRGEGFGFVLLEAMATGVPVVASTEDGTREAVRDGMLGRLVDPEDQNALATAILAALDEPKAVPRGLEYYAYPEFADRLAQSVEKVLSRRGKG
jgi:phosphatidyl-myo-inositol dimannoside synthase